LREAVAKAFKRIGARAQIVDADAETRLDVRRDRAGEYFELRLPARVEVIPLDVQPRDRHLLVLTRDGTEKARYLFGHDERAWFVAAIP
jgi:hypothetical protein